MKGRSRFTNASESVSSVGSDAELLMVVLRYEPLDVGQFVMQIFTADLVLAIVGVGLSRTEEDRLLRHRKVGKEPAHVKRVYLFNKTVILKDLIMNRLRERKRTSASSLSHMLDMSVRYLVLVRAVVQLFELSVQLHKLPRHAIDTGV